MNVDPRGRILIMVGPSPLPEPVLRKPHRRVLAILSLNLLVFLVARLGLFLVYLEDFAPLTFLEVLQSFARGLLFDASIITLITGGPLVMMLLPFRFAHHRRWLSFWTWTNFVLLALFLLLLAGDLVYFGFVHRHTGPEITALGGDVGLLFDMAFGTYWWALLGFGLACIGLFVLWRRLFRHVDGEVGRFLPRLVVLVVAVLSMAVLIRGGFGKKPLDIVDAFVGSHPAAAYLTLNGPFAMSRSLINARKVKADFFAWDEAVRRTRELVLAPGERFVGGDDYPLLRAREPGHKRKPNIVVLMLESWDAAHIDVLRRQAGQQPIGATPNFDALSRQGLLFTRFYANGERSMDGLASILAGIPTLPGTAYLGMGMEQNRMAYLGRMAQQQAYDTIFLQSSLRQSFHVDSIAAMAGFHSYLGAEDIPATGHSRNTTERGAWDHDTFQQASQLFAQARKPFVGFIFSASTHLPFQSPGEQWTRLTPDSLENRYLNALYYADWALGEFFKSAKQAGWYDNTIFILTADHISGFFSKSQEAPSLHHIPLLVIAPGLQPGVIERIGSQVDIVPTIAELAGWHAPLASIGHSLLDTRSTAPRGAFTVRGNIIERIEENGWVAHDLQRRVASSPGAREGDLAAMETRLLAMYQVAYTLLLRNRIVPPERTPVSESTR
jgi:phosphoglycerol transferase MdoB-like AlkP superfamily enzyme